MVVLALVPALTLLRISVRRARQLPAIVAVAFALAGCGGDALSTRADEPPPTGTADDARSDVTEAPPTAAAAPDRLDVAWRVGVDRDLDALVTGTLLHEGECLLLLAPEATTPRPIIWPSGTSWNHDAQQVVMADGTALEIGSFVEGGGGGGSFDVEDPALPSDLVDGGWDLLQRCGSLHDSGKFVRFDADGSVHVAEGSPGP